LLILKKKHRYQVSSLELHFPETSRNHGGAAQTPNISAIGQKSPPHAIFALWPDPRARVHGPPPVPWPLAAPGAVDPEKTSPDAPNLS
jgi:hypothetical protein